MDHSDNEILELISAGPNYSKSGKEFTHVIRYLFENPKVPALLLRISESNSLKLVILPLPSAATG